LPIPCVCFFFLQSGLTALHLAAKEGHCTIINALLDRGSPINGTTKVKIVAVVDGMSVNAGRESGHRAQTFHENTLKSPILLSSV